MTRWIARIGTALALVLAVVLAIVVAVNWAFVRQLATFSPIIPPTFAQAPADDVEARLQDLRFLERLPDYDRSFGERARREFHQLVASGRQQATTMSLAQLYLLAARASALADNGHTGVSFGPVRRDFATVGVRYFHFRDGLHVVRAATEHRSLLGGRVVEIDGRPVDAVLATLAAYTGGTAGWRRLHAVMLLEAPELVHAAGLTRSPTGYTATVTDPAGVARRVELTGRTPPKDAPAPTAKPWRTLDARALPSEGNGWVRTLGAVPEDALPLYLRDLEQLFLWEPLAGDGGYLRLQTMARSARRAMAASFAERVDPLPEGSLRYLVVDLRANGGGDFTHFVDVAARLPGKVTDDGTVYIVVGPQTFSAGLMGAALLKHHGGARALIVGTPMGDRERFWAEWGTPFRLPNSGFRIVYTTGYHDWADGCAGHPYCFPQVLKLGVAAGSLTPDLAIEPDYADYAAGRDVVMEAISERELP